VTYQVEVQTIPAQKVAAIHAHTPIEGIADTMGGAFQELYGYLAASGIAPTGPPISVYSEVDKDRGVTVEICVPVSQEITAHGRVIADELPAQTVVATLHRGSYEELPKAYEALQTFMESNHFAPSGRMREQYLNGPPEASPEDFETLVQWPVVSVRDTVKS
jgi:effector-binding domain-containing protein